MYKEKNTSPSTTYDYVRITVLSILQWTEAKVSNLTFYSLAFGHLNTYSLLLQIININSLTRGWLTY